MNVALFREVQARELAEMPDRRPVIGSRGVFGSRKAAEIDDPLTRANPGGESAPIGLNADEASFVVAAALVIVSVFDGRADAKILLPIIKGVSIDMIDLLTAPRAHYQSVDDDLTVSLKASVPVAEHPDISRQDGKIFSVHQCEGATFQLKPGDFGAAVGSAHVATVRPNAARWRVMNCTVTASLC